MATPAYVQDVRQDDNAQNLLFKIGRILAAAMVGRGSLYVRTTSAQASSAPSNETIATADATVFTLAAGEKGYIQNLDIDPLFVRRAAAASSVAFHYILGAGGSADDGTGGSIIISDHIGAVSVSGTTPRFMAWKV